MTTDIPTVSVIIPTIGRAELRSAVASAISQSLPAGEVLVIDDSGTQRAEQILSSGGRIDESVRIVRTGGLGSAAAARNIGIREARGEYIALLDDDDVWLPHHLATAILMFRADPTVDVVGARVLLSAGERSRLMPREVLRAGTLQNFFYGPSTWRARERRIATPTLVLRRDALTVSMDESLTVMEDVDWLLRLERAGCTIRQSDAVTAWIREDETRTNARRSSEAWESWLARLREFDEAAYVQYLVNTVARTAARAGDARRLAEVWLHLPSPRSRRALVIFSGWFLLLGIVRGKRWIMKGGRT